jgi:Icc-related predicted phosphoesterase
VGVLGNHDYECGQHGEVARILHEAGMKVLDGGEAFEIEGVGFAGCKGFIGGYGRYMLSAFGEPEIKAFVQASVDENLKLESSLRMLRTERIVVVTH